LRVDELGVVGFAEDGVEAGVVFVDLGADAEGVADVGGEAVGDVETGEAVGREVFGKRVENPRDVVGVVDVLVEVNLAFANGIGAS